MPFEQKYDDATRAAATARVLERRATHPDDRHVFTVVANEFNVGLQSLRAWVAAAAPDDAQPARKARRPRFSPVVTTRIEPDDTDADAGADADADVDAGADADTDGEGDGGGHTAGVDDTVAGVETPDDSPVGVVTEREDMWFDDDPVPAAPTQTVSAVPDEPTDAPVEATKAQVSAPAAEAAPVRDAPDIAALEAEVATLRRRNEALKAAMRLLLAD